MRTKDYINLTRHRLFQALFLLIGLVVDIESATTAPIFITTVTAMMESGTKVLSTSTPTTANGISSQNTALAYSQTFPTTPSITYGLVYINSNWNTTSVTAQTFLDVSISSSNTIGCTLRANFTSGTILQISINYFAFIPGATMINLDPRTILFNLTNIAPTIASSSIGSSRSTTLTMTYRTKGNFSNTLATYTTMGLSMMRASNTFEYTLQTAAFNPSSISITLTVMSNNGMSFIRIGLLNYETVVNTVDPPMYLDMGFGEAPNTVNDASGLGLTTYGKIYMGLVDWRISDSLAIIQYSLSQSGLSYSQNFTPISRSKYSYFWFRQVTCPSYFYQIGNLCYSCHYSCLTCVDDTEIGCLTCDASFNRQFLADNSTCPCKLNYRDTGVGICQKIICPGSPGYCQYCTSDNYCASCVINQYRISVNGTCVCQNYTLDKFPTFNSCMICFPTCLTCSQILVQTSCVTCDSSRDRRTFLSSNNTCVCMNGYYQIPNISDSTVNSNYLYSGAPCLQCQYTCQTCTSAAACLSCNSALGRTMNIATGFCSCNSGLYDDQIKQQCQSCPVSCLTCTTATNCVTCTSSRTLTNNSCVCIEGYYQTGAANCLACNYSCQTCNSPNACLTCNSIYSRSLSGTNCVCGSGFYDVFGNKVCQACHFTCSACTGAGNQACTSCVSANFRTFSANNSCNCMLGYYQNNPIVATCAKCYYACESCSGPGSTSCLSCNALKQRTKNGSSCNCNPKYYDDGGNQMCGSCPYFCLTCQNVTTCLTCDTTTRDTSSLISCPCLPTYYDDGSSAICPSCQQNCATCNNPSTCMTCKPLRYLDTVQACVCIARTFQPYCTSCHYSCLSCSSSLVTSCISCNGTAYRIKDPATSQCNCYQGYYDDTSNQLCQSCHPSCQTCTASTSCVTCPTNRQKGVNFCDCLPSLYQNPSSLNCLPCHYSCQTCSSFSNCTTCNITMYRQLNTSISALCLCLTGYYDNGASQLCFTCDPTCKACSAYSTCTDCDLTKNFYLNGTSCLCTAGFYLSGSTCVSCDPSCATCLSGTSCTACKPNRTATATFCTCNNGLFDDSSTRNCLPCAYPCINCVTSSSTCTLCDGTRNLASQKCVCLAGTYDIGLSCPTCLSSCQTCNNGTGCLTCVAGSLRTLSGSGNCLCPSGYHDEDQTVQICKICNYTCATCTNSISCSTCFTGRQAVVGGYCSCPVNNYYDNGVNPQCIPCDYTCLSCSGSSTTCTSCPSSTRTLTSQKCPCNVGYFDNLVAVCQTCDYTCKTCFSASSCFDCDAAKYRIYSTGPFCSCMASYFDNNVAICSSCDYTCLTCVSIQTKCLTCPNTRNYSSNTFSCPCNDGYYNNGTSTCVVCPYNCLTCSAANVCQSCDSSRVMDTSKLCPCQSNRYEILQAVCPLCASTCLTCSTFSTCTLCDTSTNFRQLINNACVCPIKYFDNTPTTTICQACHYSCQTCLSFALCSSCDITYQRIPDSTTGKCACSAGYYDNPSNQPCVLCPFDCLTCSSDTVCITCKPNRSLNPSTFRCDCLSAFYVNGSSCSSCPSECSSCVSPSNCTGCNGVRILSAGQCLCPDAFYSLSGTATCLACNYTCKTCGSPASCSSCQSTNNRISTATYCICAPGYYDDLVNQPCVTCHYSCKLCSQANACLTCDSSKNRAYNSSTKLCECANNYYEDPTSKLCISCPYSCTSCSSSTVCLSCNPSYYRVLNASQCLCQSPGYYDTLSSPICSSCSYTCLTCTSSNSTCTSCPLNSFRTLNNSACPCNDGYYDSGTQQICIKCNQACVTCTTSATQCTLCSLANYRDVVPNCACLTGYYDDGASTSCLACPYQCKTCSSSLTCDTCESLDKRTYNSLTLWCDCLVQYYDSGSKTCSACLYSCLSCNHPVECLTCSTTTRTLTNKACLCNSGFYDDSSSLNCQPCHYTCQTCTNSSSCFSCNSLNFRQLNASSILCSCLQGYYDQSVALCGKCDSSCLTCTSGTSCSSCPAGISKTLNASSGSNLCVCLYGYYENITAGVAIGYNSVCQPCYYACATCTTTSTRCTSCSSTSFRTLISNQCPCNTGYLDLAGQQNCLPCYSGCVTCSGTLINQCLSCISTSYFLNNTCYANCPSGYLAINSPKTCIACPNNCVSCPVSSSVCTQCQPTYFIFSYNTSMSVCVQSCPSLYYQISQICYKCQSPCLACTALYSCSSCVAGYYFSTSNCYPCQASCLTCRGSTALDCTTCVSNYILRSGVCQKMLCGSLQYVDSSLGCRNCSLAFLNSLTCLSTGALSCVDGFILLNNLCSSCSSVSGYTLDTTTGKCKDLCGDGIIKTDLCDDGNTLNGDGCSSQCTIQNGWTCPSNVCKLLSDPEMTLKSVANFPINNTLVIKIALSIGLRLFKNNFIVKFTKISNFSHNSYPLSSAFTTYMLVITYYESPQFNQMSLEVKSPAPSRLLFLPYHIQQFNRIEEQNNRLLASTTLQLSITLTLNITVPINTSPPAIYVNQETTQVYTSYLFYALLSLHLIVIVLVIVTFYLKLKSMLLVIDMLNSLTILYILGGLNMFNVSLVGYTSFRALQPFIYPFGQPISQFNNFSFFSYTTNYFSAAGIQTLIVIIFATAYAINSNFKTEHQYHFHYYSKGFVFAFSYDIFLSIIAIFMWGNYKSYESTFSFTISLLMLFLVCIQGWNYYLTANFRNKGVKVIPGVSFITNDQQNKEKTQNINIFQFQNQSAKEKPIRKYSQFSDPSQQATQVNIPAFTQKQQKQYFDLAPSIQTQYSLRHSNHIKSIKLPIFCVIMPFLFAIIVSIQDIKIRTILIFVLSVTYLIALLILKNQTMKSIRMIKLTLLSIIYILLSSTAMISAIKQQSINLINVDIIIISLVIFAIIWNIITFVYNIYKSQAFKEYLINKKNQEIIERNRKQNQIKQKIYNKNQHHSKIGNQNDSKANDFSIIQRPSQVIFQQNNVQISQQSVREKSLRISALKNIKRQVKDSRTMIGRDTSSIINAHIDNQFSQQIKQQDLFGKNFMDQKKIISDSKKSSPSPPKHSQANRIRTINGTEFGLVHKRMETPSYFDNSLQRIDQFVGVRRHVGKSQEKQQIIPDKQKKKKIKKRQIDLTGMQQPLNKHLPQPSKNLQDLLDESDLPKRKFHIEQRQQYIGRRLGSLSDVSSIRQERMQFEKKQQQDQSYGVNVFNKILNDFKVYKNKQTDKKKMKQLQKQLKMQKQK